MQTPLPAKAVSVTREGQPDGYIPPTHYAPQVLEGGFTRLLVSVPPERLEAVHRALFEALAPPLKVAYQQLTDRKKGVQLPKPRAHVGVELTRDRVRTALQRYRHLVYHDGRHQLWIRGADGEQLVMEEVGVIYVYPDDPSFRAVLEAQGVLQGTGETLDVRDYVRVTFDATCDSEEDELIEELGLVPWNR
jgi:hypothetical protein